MVMTARQPVNPNDNTGVGGFNQAPDATSPAAALSLFLYNQDAQQGRAAVQLSREAFAAASSGVHAPHGSEFQPGDEYPKRAGIYDKDGNEMMEIQSENDLGTNAPSSNFIYRFQGYEFFAQTRWETALHTGVSCKVLASRTRATFPEDRSADPADRPTAACSVGASMRWRRRRRGGAVSSSRFGTSARSSGIAASTRSLWSAAGASTVRPPAT
eukprot:COSAG04_NODE_2103_length_4779_cov_3.468162_7_plen_213_part_01